MLVKAISLFYLMLSEHSNMLIVQASPQEKNIAQFLDRLIVSSVYDVLSLTLSCGYDMENMLPSIHG